MSVTADGAGVARDRRFMAAAIRLSRRNIGRTRANPSVGTLIVRDEGDGGVIVGRGITAVGGRPHAETEALAEAGEQARGATAYVTLEPCAHHGHTPPCAAALIDAGIARVVGAAADPDPRVSGRGYAMLRAAGVDVIENVLASEAADAMAGYLIRSRNKRPEVILKLAVSRDGMIGRRGDGQVPITGPAARAQVHLLRSQCDAVLVGVETARADDPELTVRLPGLESRSPARIVLDPALRIPIDGKLVRSAKATPLMIATAVAGADERRRALAAAGAAFLAVELVDGAVALPELLEDLAALGMSRLLVEGGARTASAFLDAGLVDRLALFSGPEEIGPGGIASPLTAGNLPAGFRPLRETVYGPDRYLEYAREP